MNIIEQVKGDRIKTAKLKIAEFERQNGKTKTDQWFEKIRKKLEKARNELAERKRHFSKTVGPRNKRINDRKTLEIKEFEEKISKELNKIAQERIFRISIR